MGEIIKFPVRAAKFGYKRVPRRNRQADDPAQLQLFTQSTAQILELASELSSFEQALMLDEKGDPRAAEVYLRAIAAHDCIPDAYCNLGILESKAGRRAKAMDHFTNALRHDSRHAEAHYNLGNLYLEAEDFRLAQLHYELAAEFQPSFPNVFFNLGLVLSITRQFENAVSALTRYQEMTSGAEARKADELIENLRRSLAAAKPPRLSHPQ